MSVILLQYKIIHYWWADHLEGLDYFWCIPNVSAAYSLSTIYTTIRFSWRNNI